MTTRHRKLLATKGVTDEVQFFYLASVDEALNKHPEVRDYDIVTDVEPSPDPAQFNHIKFYVSRIAMDGAGGIVGDEQYYATVRLLDRERIGEVYGVPIRAEPFFVCARLCDVGLHDSPEEHEYTVAEAKEYLADDADWQRIVDSDAVDDMSPNEIIELAYDKGMGESNYTKPPTDFIQQHVSQIWDEVLKLAREFPIEWDKEGLAWTCNCEVLWDPHKTD